MDEAVEGMLVRSRLYEYRWRSHTQAPPSEFSYKLQGSKLQGLAKWSLFKKFVNSAHKQHVGHAFPPNSVTILGYLRDLINVSPSYEN